MKQGVKFLAIVQYILQRERWFVEYKKNKRSGFLLQSRPLITYYTHTLLVQPSNVIS